MALHTRRRVLLGAAGLLAGLAGCNDEPGEAGTPAASPTEPGRPRDPGDTGVRDPERHVLRYPGEGPLAWFAEDVDEDGTTTNGTTDRTIPPHEREHEGLIASESAARTLVFADVEDAGNARAFVDATDFDRESVYLHQWSVGECYRQELCSVSWADGEVRLRYVEFLRPHDVACAAGERDARATFIRLPVAFDTSGTPPGGVSTSTGRRRWCRGSGPTDPTPSERGAGGDP